MLRAGFLPVNPLRARKQRWRYAAVVVVGKPSNGRALIRFNDSRYPRWHKVVRLCDIHPGRPQVRAECARLDDHARIASWRLQVIQEGANP